MAGHSTVKGVKEGEPEAGPRSGEAQEDSGDLHDDFRKQKHQSW